MVHKNITVVEILGHKADIWLGKGLVADGIWRKEDVIVVHIDFGERPVNSTISFGIELPAKAYSKEEFIKAVTEGGSKRLSEIIEQDKRRKAKDENGKERRGVLDSINEAIESLF